MENIVELYGDVIVTVLSIIMSFALIGICMAIYRYGVICFLDSIMYGGVT
ncbi:MAG: hypothetical protein Q4F11_07900 [Eubacteriales bacterium]|nr:hypothetical protein [Eubacteriales bacterium]